MLVSRHPQLTSDCQIVSDCQFVADPDDPYRYVCLRCGQERSLKKQSEPSLDAGLVSALIGAAIATILLLPHLEAQHPAPTIPAPTLPAATH